jgi:hypothetical protein
MDLLPGSTRLLLLLSSAGGPEIFSTFNASTCEPEQNYCHLPIFTLNCLPLEIYFSVLRVFYKGITEVRGNPSQQQIF